MPMEERIKELNQYLMGWCGYFSLGGYAKYLSRIWINGFEEDYECVFGNNGRNRKPK